MGSSRFPPVVNNSNSCHRVAGRMTEGRLNAGYFGLTVCRWGRLRFGKVSKIMIVRFATLTNAYFICTKKSNRSHLRDSGKNQKLGRPF